jgi:hypothetical protein
MRVNRLPTTPKRVELLEVNQLIVVMHRFACAGDKPFTLAGWRGW